jgi:hypothetical protein
LTAANPKPERDIQLLRRLGLRGEELLEEADADAEADDASTEKFLAKKE